jgi:hypothetical protein
MTVSGYLCSECGRHCEVPISVMVKYSDRPTTPMNICPNCATIKSTIEMCCEEPGCKNMVECGTPFKGGYKHHCHLHGPADPLD